MKASELASHLLGRLLGDDGSLFRIASLRDAREGDLSIIVWPKDIKLAKHTRASCLIMALEVAADYASDFPSSLIVVDDLFVAFSVLRKLCDDRVFCRGAVVPAQDVQNAKIHKTAVIGRAVVGESIIGPMVIIEDDVVIGNNSVLGPGVVVHSHSIIENNCSIGAHSVIGSAPFVPYGVSPSQMLPSLGSALIKNHVRIGAHCTIDSGLMSATEIKEHALLDNMVHVGHDVVIGENVIIAAQTGLAGNVRLMPHVTLGGQVGVKPQVTIGEGAQISGKSMVHCDIKAYQIWSGNPSVPHKLYLKAYGKLMREGRK